MRAFLALLLVSASAHATLLHVEIENSLAPPSLQDWRLPAPLPSAFTVSFDLDTLSADSTSYLLGTSGGGGPCLLRFDYQGLNISNVAATADGMTLWQSSALNAHFAGDNPGSCPGGFFSSRFGTQPLIWGYSRRITRYESDAFLHSGDPLQTCCWDLTVVGTSALSRGRLIGDTESVDCALPEPLPVYCAGICRCWPRFRCAEEYSAAPESTRAKCRSQNAPRGLVSPSGITARSTAHNCLIKRHRSLLDPSAARNRNLTLRSWHA
jgi:hypothetical protein